MPSTQVSLTEQIKALARKAGLGEDGVRVIAAILETEGGLSGNVGDEGQSFGPFQFHMGGQLPAYAQARGLSVQQAGERARTDVLDAAQWAIDNYLGAAIRRGQKQGLSGPALATFAQREGQRSKAPEKAGQNYRALYGDGTGSKGPGGTADMAEPDSTSTNAYAQQYEEEQRGTANAIKQQIDAAQAEIDKLLEQRTAAAKRKAAAQAKVQAAESQVQWIIGSQGERIPTQVRGSADPADIQALSEATEEIRMLDARINDRDTYLKSLTTSYYSALAKVKPGLEAKLKLYEAAVAAGRSTSAQAMQRYQAEVDKADTIIKNEMAKSTAGLDAINKAMTLQERASPRFGTPETAQAVASALSGWGPILGRNINIPASAFPITPFDPMGAMKPYMPLEPDRTAWAGAQQALKEKQLPEAYEVPDLYSWLAKNALTGGAPQQTPAGAGPVGPAGPSSLGPLGGGGFRPDQGEILGAPGRMPLGGRGFTPQQGAPLPPSVGPLGGRGFTPQQGMQAPSGGPPAPSAPPAPPAAPSAPMSPAAIPDEWERRPDETQEEYEDRLAAAVAAGR